jgi:hypothetical protein
MEALSVAAFLAADSQALVERLAFADQQRFSRNQGQQLLAWEASIRILRSALGAWPAATEWRLVLEYDMRRLGRRIDAVLVTPRGIVVLEFKTGLSVFDAEARRQADDYALDLEIFHSASGDHPILPIVVASNAATGATAWPFMFPGFVDAGLTASSRDLGILLRGVWARLPVPPSPIDVLTWDSAPYRPVPGIIDAACTLYSHHGVADIASARAEAHNLTTTKDAILDAVAAARRDQHHVILFVTGIPGAGKTLCGLNAVFGAGREAGATFLTGNPSLVHVLREALARDAARCDRNKLRAARLKTKASVQKLPAFRDEYVGTGHTPPEHVIVIDEAQRAWDERQAIRATATKSVKLTASEPAHLLDIMARHADWAAVICLVGGGQEIHDGEGGLAEWGRALALRPSWRVLAAPDTLAASNPRQALPALDGLVLRESLHLSVPMRSLRNSSAASWVEAVLNGDAATARAIAATPGPALPFVLTRDLHLMRQHLRAESRGERRAGLIGSSGGKRRRADGLGVEVAHMDEAAVAHWFLNRWPDVRASEALETVATEFACQGLELDYVGLCWGGDMLWLPQQQIWQCRAFVGNQWNQVRNPETIANRRNTYRVLLTRARYQTVIWVPRGDRDDETRKPNELDRVAQFLQASGVEILSAATEPVLPEAVATLL